MNVFVIAGDVTECQKGTLFGDNEQSLTPSVDFKRHTSFSFTVKKILTGSFRVEFSHVVPTHLTNGRRGSL